MTQMDTLTRIDVPASSQRLGGSVSIAPVVFELPEAARAKRATVAADTTPTGPPRDMRTAVVDAATRASRRSRLRAAYADAVARAQADGGRLALSEDTSAFVATLRAEIARSNLRSQRPPLIKYVVRRCALRLAAGAPPVTASASS